MIKNKLNQIIKILLNITLLELFIIALLFILYGVCFGDAYTIRLGEDLSITTYDDGTQVANQSLGQDVTIHTIISDPYGREEQLDYFNEQSDYDNNGWRITPINRQHKIYRNPVKKALVIPTMRGVKDE